MKTRFITSVVATSKTTQATLPWHRGARRAAFIAKRRVLRDARKSA